MRLKHPAQESRPSSGSQLIGDQAGATMVMGVFIAMLLVSMIYYVWGIGDVIMFRERMQDASDTAAFSGAVIHARGMNMISLLNMLSSLLAIVSATALTIADMIGFAAVAAGAACAAPGGTWACPDAAQHTADLVTWRPTANRIDDTTQSLARGLRGYAHGIRAGVPLAAQAKVVSYGVGVYAPVSSGAVMAPLMRALPVEDDDDNWACDTKVYAPELPAVGVVHMSPILVLTRTRLSMFLPVGIAGGLVTGMFHAREWCREEYFQRIEEDAREHGGDPYQVQAYVFGSHDRDWTAQGVAAATWGQEPNAGSEYTSLAAMGDLSFAQAEYFYDDDENDYREWVWHMNWRARLRRYRLSGSGAGGLAEACGAACGALGGLGGSIDDLVVH